MFTCVSRISSTRKSKLAFTLALALCVGAKAQDEPPTPPATQPAPLEQPTTKPAAPEAPLGEIIEIVEGTGESPAADGAFEIGIQLWNEGYEMRPMGRGGVVPIVLMLDSKAFPGLAKLATGMKIGGKRRVAMKNKDFFGEKLLAGGRMDPEVVTYAEAELTKVFPAEPFEITTVTEGAGEVTAQNGSGLLVHYTGWTDGFDGQKKFDSSRDRDQAFGFKLGENQVIDGWERGLVGMKKGEKRRLSIPHYLAYGNRDTGAIPAYSRLYFDIELIDIPVESTTIVTTVKEGEGEGAKTGDRLKMHYTGWSDGFDGQKKFDSSRDEGRIPFDFILGQGQVIKGWDQGLIGIKGGEVRRLEVPYNEAYGAQGRPPQIPAFATLYFEVERLIELPPPAEGEMKIEVIKEGAGEPPVEGDTVIVDYTGWLKSFDSDTVFDSSKKPGREPFTFMLGKGQVIKGWDQGVAGMKPGEIRRLTIPYNLAYGASGRPPVIPEYATLYFEVEYKGKK